MKEVKKLNEITLILTKVSDPTELGQDFILEAEFKNSNDTYQVKKNIDLCLISTYKKDAVAS